MEVVFIDYQIYQKLDNIYNLNKYITFNRVNSMEIYADDSFYIRCYGRGKRYFNIKIKKLTDKYINFLVNTLKRLYVYILKISGRLHDRVHKKFIYNFCENKIIDKLHFKATIIELPILKVRCIELWNSRIDRENTTWLIALLLKGIVKRINIKWFIWDGFDYQTYLKNIDEIYYLKHQGRDDFIELR